MAILCLPRSIEAEKDVPRSLHIGLRLRLVQRLFVQALVGRSDIVDRPVNVSDGLPDATSNTATVSRSGMLRLPSQNDGSVELVKAKSSQMLQSW